MYKKRVLIEGSYYHVTSRTNNKIRVFEGKLGQKIMLITLQEAKEIFRFRLANFCIMPTHIHLLIKPEEGSCLSKIMYWIKMHSAKRWNCIHGSTDHLWGNRFFARAIRNQQEYENIMNYIDQNPIRSGLVQEPDEWKASGAYYRAQKIPDLVDFKEEEYRKYIKLLSPIPPAVSRIIPPRQLSHITQYYGAYIEVIEKLYANINEIPLIGDIDPIKEPKAFFRYFTDTEDYFIYSYDTQNTMYGKIQSNIHPFKEKYQVFNLSSLKNNDLLKLDLSWKQQLPKTRSVV